MRQNTDQAARHTQMKNALEGRQQNNNDSQNDETANDDSISNDESSQNEFPPADQAIRADEGLIKHYNQCKPKEFKGI